MKSLNLILVLVALAVPVMAHAKKTSERKLEVVARIQSPDPSGIVVTKEGRIFLGFPRHAVDHHEPSLAEYVNGKLIPFPNRTMTMPSDLPPDQRLVSPHGMTLDKDGNLWLIDDGKRANIKDIPEGAAKVVGINLKNGEVFAKAIIKAPVLLPDSHLNDLRIDLTHGEKGMAYITDSSFGVTPALVVVDLAKGISRRILENHISTRNEPGYMAFLEGQPHTYNPKAPTFPVGGADGITLSEDSKRLYWTPLTGRRFFSISTDVLSNMTAGEDEIQKAVVDEQERPACDGIDTDSEGRIYFGAYEQQSLVRKNKDGSFERLVQDSRLGWPDALFVSGNYLYVTLGQWNRLAGFNKGTDLRKPPYLVVRVSIK